MLRSVLVGLDGSAYSSAAVELGIAWAKRSGALLVGLGIIDEPSIRRPAAVPLGAGYFKQHRDEALFVHARSKVEQFLEEFALRCAGEQIACKLLEDVGLPHEQILLEAQRYDLILLGQQTYFEFETQSGPGETLYAVLKSSPRPVVTVPEKLPASGAVLIAYDGSLQSARTLQMFQALGMHRSQPVHVISVNDEHTEAARHGDRAVEFLRLHDITASLQALKAGSAATVILEQARQLNAELIVMGAYGHSGLHDFFFGSVTQTMLRESKTPLFLYH